MEEEQNYEKENNREIGKMKRKIYNTEKDKYDKNENKDTKNRKRDKEKEAN